MLSSLPWWCFACILCSSPPDWPEDGVATREWVVEALEWRLDRGLSSCNEVMPAIDAWTLEWISESDELSIEITTSEWPVFTSEPLLQGPLIQIMALESFHGKAHNPGRVLSKLRRFARRSDKVWSEKLKIKFEETKELQKEL